MRLSLRHLTAGVAVLATSSLIGVAAPAALARTPERVGATPAAQPMNLVLPLVADTAGLDRFATAVSTPGNPMYGQYEPVSWLSQKFGASTATRERALRFLRGHGAAQVHVNGTGLFAEATMSAARAERIFQAPLAQFRDGRSGRSFTKPTGAVRIPKALRGVVSGVVGLNTTPLIQQPVLQTRQDTNTSAYTPVSGTPSGCAAAMTVKGFTPNQYLDAYGFNTLQADGLLGQGERVAVVEIDGFQQSDLKQFAACFGLHVPHVEPFAVDLPAPVAPGGETTLDLEVLMSTAPDLAGIDVYESQSAGNLWLETLTEPLTARGLTPNVISSSVGICSSTLLQGVGHAGVNAGESVLAEATASGISVTAASGDDGAADCQDKNGEPVDKADVDYPAASKWVTGVGGTNLHLNADNTIASEQVWNEQNALTDQQGKVVIQGGGGGFSTLFPRPHYQTGTVTQNQRAVPDVAMLADSYPGYDIYCSAVPGCRPKASVPPWQPVGGTSAASPLLAGGFALIDQYLRGQGKQDLGFANPLLYQIGRNPTLAPSVFDDVTDGTNDVGALFPGGAPFGCCDAAPGYDEASGWGGVNVANLASVAAGLVPKIVKIAVGINPKQRPVAARGIFAHVKCTASCRAQAVAVIRVGRLKPFAAASKVSSLNGAKGELAKIVFKPAQVKLLHEALAHHLRASARVTAAILDSKGDPVRQSATKTLAITR